MGDGHLKSNNMKIRDLIIGIKGAGEQSSGIAWRLFRANIQNLFMMEKNAPLAIRRSVSFCEALYCDTKVVEGVTAEKIEDLNRIKSTWDRHHIAVLKDPKWHAIKKLSPHVVIDATIAKKNLGTSLGEAPLVIGLGPGFEAGKDVHMVIETHRGHNLGRVIYQGTALTNTGIPGNIDGFTIERILRAPMGGTFESEYDIGMAVTKGQVVAMVAGHPVTAKISGVIRGLIKPGTRVGKGLKVGDIDPRGDASFCHTLSDKSRALGGAVLEAILKTYN
jgi:xanthine dehydrogenase accessory factor